MKVRAALVTLFLAIMSLSQTAVAKRLDGTVTVGGQPVAGASVTLWRTAGKEAPKSVAQVSTGAKGDFALHDFPLFTDGGVFYLTTRGGSSDALALMSVLGTKPPDNVVVNELTTVASAFTSARFINGESSPAIRWDCESRLATHRTWSIPRPANGAKSCSIRSTAPRPRRWRG